MIHCDNLGVVTHGNHYQCHLPEKQVQSDLITVLCRNIATFPNPIRFVHVYGHSDDTTAFADLTLHQQLNVMANILAKQALDDGIGQSNKDGATYPNEMIRIMVKKKKVTSSIRSALYSSWGATTAQHLFQCQDIVCSQHFHTISWSHVHCMMAKVPHLNSLWLSKHASSFCGTN